MRRSSVLALAAVILVAACRAGGREPAAPKPPPPLPPAVALAIQQEGWLLACDKGVVDACAKMGNVLVKAKHFDAAIAAYDHGCHIGARARVEDRDAPCADYLPGGSCEPEHCARCSSGQATEADACTENSAPYCAVQCKARTLSACLELEQARLCSEVAHVYHDRVADVLADQGEYCAPARMTAIFRAKRYAAESCDRFEASGLQHAPDMNAHTYCGRTRRIDEDIEHCNEMARSRARADADLAAMRAQTTATVMQSVAGLAQTADGIAAANKGYVPGTFTPGAPAVPGMARGYVNPQTGAQWTSPNLALIATLVPGGVRAPAPVAKAGPGSGTRGASPIAAPPGSAPGDASANEGACKGCDASCSADKAACAKGTQRSCYLAAACLCRCNLSAGGCGSDVDALRRCAGDNEANARKLESGAPAVAPSSPPPPKPNATPKPPAPKPPAKKCPGPGACAETAL